MLAKELACFLTSPGDEFPVLWMEVGSSGVAGNSTRYRSEWAPRAEAAIALQVEREPLEEAHDIAQPITAPFEHFELVVQPFHKAAALPIDEVVGNQV